MKRRQFLKGFSVSTGGIALGFPLLGKEKQKEFAARTYLTPNSQTLRYLIPVESVERPNEIVFKAGSEEITFHGKLLELKVNGHLSSKISETNNGILTYSAFCKSEEEIKLKGIIWFYGEWGDGIEKEVQSTTLCDNILFLRKGEISFFVSLDFPFSRIGETGISYSPFDIIQPGQNYEIYSVSVGACRLSGEKIGKFDKNEIEAVSEYVEHRFPPRFRRPMFLAGSITNRMTDLREGRIFYSMYDNPTLYLHPELIMEDLKICSDLGIEYYQYFEGFFDWPDQRMTGKNLLKIKENVDIEGLKIGDYVSPQGLYCPHFNYEHRSVGRVDWLIVDEDGKAAGPECLAIDEYYKYLFDTTVNHNKRYNLQLICLDFLNIRPCYATHHNHEPGDVFRQIRALVKFMQALNGLDPDFMVWSNSGNWLELMPKLLWYNPNVYLTDPHVRKYSSHLNMLKFLGDGRREQMVSVHENYFVPYRNFTNLEYYAFPDSRLSDVKIFGYSFLQGLAVTPNIGFGELRTFFNRIPSRDEKQCRAFIKKWLSFIREHYEVWKQVERIGDFPGVGAIEIYAHMKNGRGFIVFVNQNPFPRKISLTLDEGLNIKERDELWLYEHYPTNSLIGEQALPFSKYGDSLELEIPGQQVRIIEIKDRDKKASLPLLFGLKGIFKKTTKGFELRIKAQQGEKFEVGLLLPEQEELITIDSFQKPDVPMYTFPVETKILNKIGNKAFLELIFPRGKAPTALSSWLLLPENKEIKLPTQDLKGFLGAYVHNAFSEEYEIILRLQTHEKETNATRLKSQKQEGSPFSLAFPGGNHFKLSTQFELPFIETFGLNRGLEDDAIIELAFEDPNRISKILGKINENPVPIKTYYNPKTKQYKTFYIELKGTSPGSVKLEIEFNLKKD